MIEIIWCSFIALTSTIRDSSLAEFAPDINRGTSRLRGPHDAICGSGNVVGGAIATLPIFSSHRVPSGVFFGLSAHGTAMSPATGALQARLRLSRRANKKTTRWAALFIGAVPSSLKGYPSIAEQAQQQRE